MDEGGEALSPLVAAKAQAQMAAAQGAGPAAAAAATPGSGSVGGTPGMLPGSASAHPAAGAASSERAGPSGTQQQQQQRQQQPNGPASAGRRGSGAGSGQRTANGYAVHGVPSPAAGAAGMDSQGVAFPIDYSTMAVDLAPAGPGDAPQPSASFQPSSLPPPGAVAAALAALEAAQAAQNGSLWQTPPPPAAEQLGEVIQALSRQASRQCACVIGMQAGAGRCPAQCMELWLRCPAVTSGGGSGLTEATSAACLPCTAGCLLGKQQR